MLSITYAIENKTREYRQNAGFFCLRTDLVAVHFDGGDPMSETHQLATAAFADRVQYSSEFFKAFIQRFDVS